MMALASAFVTSDFAFCLLTCAGEGRRWEVNGKVKRQKSEVKSKERTDARHLF